MLPVSQATDPQHTPPPVPVIWLDLLPLDASVHIARTLNRFHSHEHTFNLALSTPYQALTVSTALDNIHVIRSDAFSYPNAIQHQRKVATAIRPHIVNLQVYCKSIDPYCGRHLFTAPDLRSITVPGTDAVLRFVPCANQLKALSINVDHTVSRPLLLKVLSRVPICKLTLNCTCDNPHKCFFRRYIRKGTTIPDLASACATLSDLTILCCCRTESDQKFWSFVAACANLRNLTVRLTPPKRFLPFLRKVTSINYFFAIGNIEYATRLSSNVKCLSWCDPVPTCTRRDLLAITTCTHLRQLEITIDNRVDILLANLIRKLPELEKLGLLWGEQLPQRGSGEHKMQFDDNGPMHDPSPGALCSIMREAYNVKAIDLRGIRLHTSELRALLGLMGPRLEELTLSTHEQWEPELNRLEHILHMIVQFNSQLKVLHLRGLALLEPKIEYSGVALMELDVLMRIQRLLNKLEVESKIGNLAKLKDKFARFFESHLDIYHNRCPYRTERRH